jgi:hypothetical protein
VSWKATRNRLVAVAALVCISPAIAQADWNARAPEKTFVYRGKPIDPRCVTAFSGINGAPSHVNLVQCTGFGLVKRDGHTFSVTDPDENSLSTAYDSYEVLAQNGMHFVISTDWNGGGSGYFTDLFVVDRRGAILSVDKMLSGTGDRCNGGISGNSVRGHVLRWSEQITPYDLTTLGGLKTLAAYKDLESSAASCVATRNMEYDLDTGATRFVSVTLRADAGMGQNGRIEDQKGWTENYTYQHCFNTYYNHHVAASKHELDPDALKRFVQSFAQACGVKRS